MAGRKKIKKQCVECGEKIMGIKDYCKPCHAKILEKLKKRRRKEYL